MKAKKSYLRVLVHKFNSWEEMFDYMVNLINRGECKVLPKVVQCTEWENGKITNGWSWQPYVNEKNELHFK